MGQLVIEVPQNINLKVSVKSAEIVDEILELVKKPKKMETITLDLPYDLDDVNENDAIGIWANREESGKMPAVIPPRRNSLKEDGDAVLGIWADNEEDADEIARRVREANRRTT